MWQGKSERYSSEHKFKFEGGQVLRSLFYIEIPILLAGENVVLELYTSESGHYFLDIHSNFPSEAVCLLFSVKTLIKSEKVKAAERYITNIVTHHLVSLRKC